MSITKQNLIEVFPGFFYPKAPDVTGFKSVMYRVSQLFQVIFSKKFNDDSKIFQSTLSRYEEKDQLDFYRAFTHHGLLDFEKDAIQAMNLPKNTPLTALVIGCGAGREVFSLEKAGMKTTGIDISPRFIALANSIKNEKSSNAEFLCGDFKTLIPETTGFDLIWFTYGLLNHVPGKKNRIDSLNAAKDRLNPHGMIHVAPDMMPISSILKMNLASLVLKLKWRGENKWEKGDTLRSNLGPFSNSSDLIYYHYYPDNESIISEFKACNLKEKLINPSWILQE